MPKAGEIYYKAVRPDGTSFFDPSFRWLRKDGKPYKHPIMHPDFSLRGPEHYLSAATVPTDCTAMRWPCRLLTVEPFGEVFHPSPQQKYPNKRVAGGWRVTGELPATDALGPQGPAVAAIIDRAEGLTTREFETFYCDVPEWSSEYYSLQSLAIDSNREAAWMAMISAIECAAHRAASKIHIFEGAHSAIVRAAHAVVAEFTRDLIPSAVYDELAAPWYSVVGRP